MNIISSSYGNDSVALIRWAHEQRLPDVEVVYCDTGWASPTWAERVAKMSSLRAGVEVLPHRSLECNPCVNANRQDFLRLMPGEIDRVNDIEVEIGKPMFRPKRFGVLGIHGVMVWAKEGRNRQSIEDEEEACAGLFGCGL
jgi:3'-phosphoadenosine 5'-phosphosulfate sulfotransferase (PAPS reductase)/FAD synthetase